MSRRIEIELTSSRPDGTWTWRAAGAREPKGVLDGSVLAASSKVGDVLKVEADFDIDGISILSVVAGKERVEKSNKLELLASDKPFKPVIETKAPRSERPRRDDKRPGRGPRTDKSESAGEGADGRKRRGPFTPPPELPQRPKAKRLRPGRAHRNEVLAGLPEAQRAIAERVLQGGIPAVRAAVAEQNKVLAAEGKEVIPADGLVTMAENLLPKLRVAEWLDRADAAVADLDALDLRDLRSVVTSGDDPAIARDESTRAVAAKLKEGLAARQEKDHAEWLSDIDAALGVGRVVRALKLSSQPPKAGARFPADLATRLAAAASAALEVDAPADRWVATLEAAAFSPVRSQLSAAAVPAVVAPELLACITRLGPAVPQIAAKFGVVVAPGAAMPRPLRPTRPFDKKGADKKGADKKGTGGRGPRQSNRPEHTKEASTENV
jgi:ribosomal protein L15